MLLKRYAAILPVFLATAVHVSVPVAAHRQAGSVDAYAFRSRDSIEYYRIAVNIAAHGVFSQNESPPWKPDTWRTPGYPIFLATFIFLFGDSPAGLIIVQQLLGILNVWLLFRIACRFMSEPRAAIAALLFLFEPYHLYYSLWLMATTVFLTALLGMWLAWLRAVAEQRWYWFMLSGALAGAAVLIRPVALLVPILLFMGLLVAAYRGRRSERTAPSPHRTWLGLTTFALSCGVLVGPWMVRNRIVAGHVALSHQGGIVLAYFKATEVALWNRNRTADRYVEASMEPTKAGQPRTVWNEIDARLRDEYPQLTEVERSSLRWSNLAQGNRTTVDSFEISRALSGIAWSYLLEKPMGTLACCLTRCGSILTFPLNLALRPATGVPERRVRSLVLAAPFVLLAAAVVLRLLRGRMTFHAAYVPLACTAALLVATTPQLDPRFRVPMIPFLIVLALLPAWRRRGT